MVEPMVPAPPVTRTRRAGQGRHRTSSSRGSGWATSTSAPRARRLVPAASSTDSTRSPAAPSVPDGPALADAGGELADHHPERLALVQGRRPGVAEPVVHRRRTPVGLVDGLLDEVHAAVVDAEPLLRVQVVPDQGPLAAADHHLADLGRAEPVDVDVRHGAVGQGQGQVADAGLAGAERVRALGGDAERRQPAGQDVVEDRQVVRGQVPEDVDVGLDQPEVDAHRVDEEDLAERALARPARGSSGPPACSSRCGPPSA